MFNPCVAELVIELVTQHVPQVPFTPPSKKAAVPVAQVVPPSRKSNNSSNQEAYQIPPDAQVPPEKTKTNGAVHII
jgi:hypothetical protein